MLNDILFTIILTILLLAYFRIADKFNIIDKPNHRSSHSNMTIRGGGIIFPFAALLWFFTFGLTAPWSIAGLGIIAVVSFWDDVNPLSSKIRIVAHLAAVSLLFVQLQLFGLPWFVLVIAYIFTIGWINAFNFMDGINGITAFYGITALATFAWLNHSTAFVSQELIILLVISVIIFSFFNARKRAKTFAGDVGSVSLAFLLVWFMLTLMLKTGRIEYILLFAVYGIDSVITIIYRLKRNENIFKAHRTHLYQYLSNAMKWAHVKVALVYAGLQAVVNILTILLISNGMMNLFVFALMLLSTATVYLVCRIYVTRNNSLLK